MPLFGQQNQTSFWRHSLIDISTAVASSDQHLQIIIFRIISRSIFFNRHSCNSSSLHSSSTWISASRFSTHWHDIRQTHPKSLLIIINPPLPLIISIDTPFRRNHLPTATTQSLCGWAMCVTQTLATICSDYPDATHLCYTIVPFGYTQSSRHPPSGFAAAIDMEKRGITSISYCDGLGGIHHLLSLFAENTEQL